MGREMPFTRRRLRHRQPDFIADLDDRLVAPASLARALRSRSALVVPIHGEVGMVGAITIGWRAPQRSVDRLNMRTMMLVAGEVGLAVERHREADRVRRQARTDPLTGLLNRRAFDEHLLTLAPGDAVLLIDLDHFKAVNDRDGHAAGDRVLRSLAACISSHIRISDVGARIGGDELAIVLRGAGPGDARRLAESLRVAWNCAAPGATISIGVASHEEGRDVALTVARADRALYTAKEAGRDCTVGDEVGPGRARPGPTDGTTRRPRLPSGADGA
jgi:diguanylate cyclase (GGDEF)-like protein